MRGRNAPWRVAASGLAYALPLAAVGAAVLPSSNGVVRAGADVPTPTGGVDAIFVRRERVWWLVDDGAHRSSPPPWTLAPRDARTLGPDGARALLDAVERGEGGGYADRTGLGPPATPWPDAFDGVVLVAVALDVATVFRSDDAGRERVIRATRLAESDDPTSDGAASGEGARNVASVGATRPRRVDARQGPLDAARRRALEGDAPETLRLLDLAGWRGLDSAPPPLLAIAAQALGRIGRAGESADCLRRLGERADDPRVRAAARGLETVTRARGGGGSAARAGEPGADDVGPVPSRSAHTLDESLATLPELVRAGRSDDAMARVARALDDPVDAASVASPRRRRAVLAAAALALERGDLDAAARMLRHGASPPLAADVAPVVDRLRDRLASRLAARATPPAPRPSDAARGVGNRPRGG